MAVTAVADRRRMRQSKRPPATGDLARLLGRRASGLGAAVAAREFLDATGGIDKLLFAGEKRMASGADADFNVPLRRTRVVDRAARTGDVGLVILRMNVRFHVRKRAANLGAIRPGAQAMKSDDALLAAWDETLARKGNAPAIFATTGKVSRTFRRNRGTCARFRNKAG